MTGAVPIWTPLSCRRLTGILLADIRGCGDEARVSRGETCAIAANEPVAVNKQPTSSTTTLSVLEALLPARSKDTDAAGNTGSGTPVVSRALGGAAATQHEINKGHLSQDRFPSAG